MEYVIIWLLFGLTATIIANSKGRNGCGWFLLGVLIGPFALIVAALPSLKAGQTAPTPETHVICPDCAELIRKEARVCKHCGCKISHIEPQADGEPDEVVDRVSLSYKAGRAWARMGKR